MAIKPTGQRTASRWTVALSPGASGGAMGHLAQEAFTPMNGVAPVGARAASGTRCPSHHVAQVEL
jgi:hypothetical protein